MKNILILLFAIVLAAPAAAREKIRVACVGNSVTYGYGLRDREHTAYPVRLQALLGDGYDVRNFGHSGATLLRHGHRPYDRLPEFRAALDFKADLVVIHLGLNDTDPRNWPQYADEFIPDYRALIDSFRTANPQARVWICRMTPIFPGHSRFESGTREWHSLIQQRIGQIARTAGTGLIDLYEPLHCRPDLFADALHPNAEGADILARTVYGALTGDYGGLALPETYGDGMVMQRDRPLTVAGRANAGETVTVDFLSQRLTATAGADGRWSVTYPPQPAGGPYELHVHAKSGERRIRDVWTGEVWVCSGQSNMELRLREIATAREDIAAADTLARVRLYNMRAIVPTYAAEWDSARLDSVNRLQYVQPGRWERCTSAAAEDFSAIALHFGRVLADSLGCHVGLISNAVGGSGTESWIDRATLEREIPALLRDWKRNDHLQGWVRGRVALNTKRAANPLQRHPYEPAYLFENAIRPLADYGVRGILWYQGESNAHNVELHERLFALLEKSWRRHWKDRSLPFYFVQLSGIATRPSWPHFRDSQRRLAGRLPHTWMTVSSDLGDSLDVHPRRKREIGERLAASALCHTYGRATVPEGPAYKSFEREGGSLRLHFGYAEGLRAADGRLRGFEVAGADGLYHAAEARIEGNDVVVANDTVPEPCAVRYGWRPFTDANLTNGAGLPASTFRDERSPEAAGLKQPAAAERRQGVRPVCREVRKNAERRADNAKRGAAVANRIAKNPEYSADKSEKFARKVERYADAAEKYAEKAGKYADRPKRLRKETARFMKKTKRLSKEAGRLSE